MSLDGCIIIKLFQICLRCLSVFQLTQMFLFVFVCFVLHSYGKIVSTKAILDKTTNTCKGKMCCIISSLKE